MAGAEKVAEKIPRWVERILVPTLESRVRAIVKDEVGHLEKTMDAKFEAMNEKFEAVNEKFGAVNVKFDAVNGRIDSLEQSTNARFDAVSSKIDSLELGINARFDSLEERISTVQDIADLKIRLAAVERRTAG